MLFFLITELIRTIKRKNVTSDKKLGEVHVGNFLGVPWDLKLVSSEMTKSNVKQKVDNMFRNVLKSKLNFEIPGITLQSLC